MMRIKILLLLVVLAAGACQRREITYYMEAEIEMRIDWSNAELDEKEADYGATAVFYPQDGNAPKTVLMGNREYGKVRLPRGKYNVVVFNRSFDDFACVAFRGTDSHHTIEAYASRVETRVEEITDTPEKLAADYIEGFEVTEDMLGNYSEVMRNRNVPEDECTLCMQPRKLVEEMKVTVHIKGMNNVRNAVATIDGVAASVFLATGKKSEMNVTQRFELGNPSYYEGSPFDGTMTATFNAFDFNAEQKHHVRIQALLVDGKSTFEQDFSDMDILQETGDNGKMVLVLEVGTEKVPDVKPEEGGGSGFDAEVEGWGEEQKGEINM